MNKINEHSLIYETVPLEKTGINLLITVYSSLNGTETRTGVIGHVVRISICSP